MLARRIFTVALLAAATFTFAGHTYPTGHVGVAPEGMNQFIVYMTNGIYDPSIPGPGPEEAMAFQTDIYGRSDEEIAQLRVDAVEFFINRFGIDPDAEEWAGRVIFFPYYLDPRTDYNAHTIGGMWTPKEGWQVHDGGWLMVVTDPNGINVNGEFDNEFVAPGSMAFFGDYVIAAKSRPWPVFKTGRQVDTPVKIHFEAGAFVQFNIRGEAFFSCDLHHPEWGYGKAQGYVTNLPAEGGMIQSITRNIITFMEQ